MNTIRELTPLTYAQASSMLGNRTDCMLCNNTKLQRIDNDTLAVSLHNTDIVTIRSNGDTMYTSGGWRTVTTKQRLNALLPHGYTIIQQRGTWYVYRDGERVGTYADGLTIRDDGSIHGLEPKALTHDAAELRKSIRVYARGFIAALQAGEVSRPSVGDCWYCHMREVNSGDPLGETLHDTEHLQFHLEESYYVPSLLWRAIVVGRVLSLAESWVHLCMLQQGLPVESFYPMDVIEPQVYKALVKYLDRELLHRQQHNAASAIA